MPRSRYIVLALVVTVIFLVLGTLLLLIKDEEPAPTPEPVIETETPEPDPRRSIIGTSVLGRSLEVYTFGRGETHLLFVGGIHGGYEWNSVLLAYDMIDHLTESPDTIPETLTVSIIPSLNPDGVFKVIGKEGRFSLADVPADTGDPGNGRFNANGVDLNRNFDCKWQPESSWRGNTVSAGTAPFSEPEALALKDFVIAQEPDAVVFWHSQANAVYASECEAGVLPKTLDVMNIYGDAAGYNTVASFDAYPVTGDAEGWLASLGIPAVTVELATHETIEWQKNLSGTMALFEHYDRLAK